MVRRLWWPPSFGLFLCGLGLGVAGYLTYEHYTGSTSLSCPAGGSTFINCLGVTTSIYSKIHGVPVAVLGLVFFAVMAVLQSPPAWRSGFSGIRVGRILWSLAGVGTALYLIYDELFRLDEICLWCTSAHVISLLLFILTVFGTAATAPVPIEPGDEADVMEDSGERVDQVQLKLRTPQG